MFTYTKLLLCLEQPKLEVGSVLSFPEEKVNHSETERFVQCANSIKNLTNSNPINHVPRLYLLLIVLWRLSSLMDLGLEMCHLES